MTTIIRDWELDLDFAPLLQRLRGRTLVAEDRCYFLYQLGLHLRQLPGHVVEFGVYKGGTATLLSEVYAGKEIHLYDSFAGLPEVSALDGFHKGDFAEISEADLAFIRALPRAVVHQGFFDVNTEVPAQVCFGHIDCDIYPSILNASIAVWPSLVPGGALVYDDYGFSDCWGAKPAVLEFCRRVNAQHLVIGNGQAVVFKRPSG
jgi:O-methyltransferase